MAREVIEVITGKVRLSFPHLFVPRKPTDDDGNVTDGPEKYSALFLLPKSDLLTVGKIQVALDACKVRDRDTWPLKDKAPLNPMFKNPLRDGDLERDTEERPEYAGHWFINASSKFQPGLIDRNKAKITDPTELYAGCFVRVVLNPYGFSQKGNNGISLGLSHIQKIAEGDPLSGTGTKAEDAFDDLASEYDDDYTTGGMDVSGMAGADLL